MRGNMQPEARCMARGMPHIPLAVTAVAHPPSVPHAVASLWDILVAVINACTMQPCTEAARSVLAHALMHQLAEGGSGIAGRSSTTVSGLMLPLHRLAHILVTANLSTAEADVQEGGFVAWGRFAAGRMCVKGPLRAGGVHVGAPIWARLHPRAQPVS